ncbi:hypothetical protein [Pleionea litopenaei]|uniref:ornithine carbamoyltransferase n=1 Tax=Pleionea litopenaei TaxID=3070815 RepID=A0AA51RS50_9GAMM|nr:hypothetical protein [Pleionea sp. HL-JVS1]WMS86479.1 hypothetical protein Q9312_14755 [Pleionea sp. HL-JVS1]
MGSHQQNFITGSELSGQQLVELLNLSKKLVARPEDYRHALRNKHFVMLFEKPSLRTRASFEVGIEKMGGKVHFYDMQHSKIGQREPIVDLAQNLQQWYDAVIARVDEHQTLREIQTYCELPVINALCDQFHPCQALADIFTLFEINEQLEDWHIAYVGDANNVTRSLLVCASLLNIEISVVTPKGNSFSNEEKNSWSEKNKGRIHFLSSAEQLEKCHVIYTDVWQSMGQQKLTEEALLELSSFQVNDSFMQRTKARYFMHCQPVHRGQEVTSEVCDGKQSLMYQQSRNRMIAQQALIYSTFSGLIL